LFLLDLSMISSFDFSSMTTYEICEYTREWPKARDFGE